MLSIELDGIKKYLVLMQLPFSLNDAARVLTKVLRSVVRYWGTQGIQCFIHLDDGFSFCASCEQCEANCRFVRQTLKSCGLLISESKCTWGARTVLEWTGFIWDTNTFELSISEKKVAKAKFKAQDLLSKSVKGDTVSVRQLASYVGLVISFFLAMGGIS